MHEGHNAKRMEAFASLLIKHQTISGMSECGEVWIMLDAGGAWCMLAAAGCRRLDWTALYCNCSQRGKRTRAKRHCHTPVTVVRVVLSSSLSAGVLIVHKTISTYAHDFWQTLYAGGGGGGGVWGAVGNMAETLGAVSMDLLQVNRNMRGEGECRKGREGRSGGRKVRKVRKVRIGESERRCREGGAAMLRERGRKGSQTLPGRMGDGGKWEPGEKGARGRGKGAQRESSGPNRHLKPHAPLITHFPLLYFGPSVKARALLDPFSLSHPISSFLYILSLSLLSFQLGRLAVTASSIPLQL